MSILSQVERGRKVGPPRGLIYSDPKVGKTTLIASIPDVVIIPLEEGQGVLDYARTPQPEDYATLVATLRELATTDHPYKAVGIDTLSGVQELIWQKVCEEEMGGSWDKFWAYFRGPSQAATTWVEFCKELDAVRRKGLSIWCTAHSKLDTVEDVSAGSYSRITPDIDKRSLPVLEKWSDIIGHIEIERFATEKGGENRKTRTTRTTGTRQLIVEDTGSVMAGNRYGLESPIELPEADPYGALRGALIKAIQADQPESKEAA